mgnify:CR=1 FL=1
MGMSLQRIPFFVMDNSAIEVVSASKRKDFNLKKLNDFINKRGGFSRDEDDPNHYFFEYSNGDFVEFYFV